MRPIILSNLQERVSDAAKRVSHSISFELFSLFFNINSWSNGQTPPPPTESVSAHHWFIPSVSQIIGRESMLGGARMTPRNRYTYIICTDNGLIYSK